MEDKISIDHQVQHYTKKLKTAHVSIG